MLPYPTASPAFHIRLKICLWAYFDPPSPREKVRRLRRQRSDKHQFVQCHFDFTTHSALLQLGKNYAIVYAEVIKMDKKGSFWVPLVVLLAVFAVGIALAVLF